MDATLVRCAILGLGEAEILLALFLFVGVDVTEPYL